MLSFFARQRLLPLESVSCRRSSNVNCKVDVDKCAEHMCKLVQLAAEHMRKASKRTRTFDTKGHSADLVTSTDKEIEKLLICGLQQQFPKHVYIGEEGVTSAATGRQLTDEPTWIIDPIDGTTNFVHGFHYSCISVGFWLNKRPELAICHNPLLHLNFTARRNQGAYLNGSPMRTSGQTDLERSVIMHELNAANFESKLMTIQIANAKKMLNKAQAVRTSGSAAMNLCLVAMGAADGYYEFFPHSWDMAAGALLVREAGGALMDPAGGEFDLMSRRVLVAATPQLACQIVQLLGDMQIYHQRDDKPAKKN